MAEYDYLVVGAGLYGSIFAHEMKKRGKRCLVIDKRNHIGGNCYTKSVEGIQVHKYGAHIFHTSDKEVWDYVNGLVEFNRYTNSPVARWKDELYNLPFVYAVWAIRRGIDSARLCRLLREARDFGMDTLDYLISSRSDYDLEFRKDYLGWHIHYHLAEDEKRGIAKFCELLRKHNLGPVFEPKYVR